MERRVRGSGCVMESHSLHELALRVSAMPTAATSRHAGSSRVDVGSRMTLQRRCVYVSCVDIESSIDSSVEETGSRRLEGGTCAKAH